MKACETDLLSFLFSTISARTAARMSPLLAATACATAISSPSFLADRGPMRFVELRELATRRIGGKSPHSIGPILLTSGEFVRPLPGIYALPAQVPSSTQLLYDPPAFLLADEQARYLAEARYSGEPFGRFSMWSPEAEYALCRWGQSSGNPQVFQSLLAVASIDLWPVSDQERAHWSELKRVQSRYCLTVTPRYPVRELWPPLDRVLAACIAAAQDHGIGWIAANRILKRRIDAHVAPGLLALMVALRALDAPSQWQMAHRPGAKLSEIIELLSTHLHQTGALAWESSAGRGMIERLKRAWQAGWVDRTITDDLLYAATGKTAGSLPLTGETDESTSSLDELLREVVRNQEAEVSRQTLNSLLG